MFNEYLEQIRQMALEAYPNEGCAVITKKGFRVVPNVAEDPSKTFEIAPRVMAGAFREGLLAIVHSHPDGPDCPSESDMRGQIQTKVPWGIISTNGEACLPPFWFGDQVPREPLEGRGFRHGVTDCYSLIRDYYWMKLNVLLPEFPRDAEWWRQGQSLYTEGFPLAGFNQISESQVQPGDVFLAQIRSNTPNHGGVYIGDELILHHLSSIQEVDKNRLSAREPVHRWRKHITHWLRYEGNIPAR